MKVGIQARLKNGILWEAAKKMGTNTALAAHLGVDQGTLGRWINFQACPDFDNPKVREQLAEVEQKLIALTGCDFELIFPPEVRGKMFLRRQKRIEAIVEMPVEQLIAAGAVPLLASAPDELLFQKEAEAVVEYALGLLRPREAKVIEFRFGLNGEEEHTLEECAEYFKVTRERVRQIETKALNRLRHPHKANQIKRMLGTESLIEMGTYHPEPHKF